MERIPVSDKFYNPCKHPVAITADPLSQTEGAVKIACKRVLLPAKENDDGTFYLSVFNDEMWIPKSQIQDGKISAWLVEKESIISA